MNRRSRRIVCVFLIMILSAGQFTEAKAVKRKKFPHTYGVFLSAGRKDIKKFKNYKTIVIDVQYFKKKDISKLKKQGHTIYSYINIGSLEDFRPYYKKYRKYTLKPYEYWNGEYWADVSRKPWQKKIKRLAGQFVKMGVDGFFVDNCDVYAQFPKKKIYRGVTKILGCLRRHKKKEVILNGGDVYVRKYYKKHKTLSTILTGINQEEIFTLIDFKNRKLKKARAGDKKYFLNYVKFISRKKKKVYLLEYTKDIKLKRSIHRYCKKKKWECYITGSINLDF